MTHTVLVIATMVILGLSSSAAAARGPCAPTKTADENLRKKHGEVPVFAGLNRGGVLFQVYRNADTGAWTATVTHPSLMSTCVVDAGRSGELIDPPKPGKKL